MRVPLSLSLSLLHISAVLLGYSSSHETDLCARTHSWLAVQRAVRAGGDSFSGDALHERHSGARDHVRGVGPEVLRLFPAPNVRHQAPRPFGLVSTSRGCLDGAQRHWPGRVSLTSGSLDSSSLLAAYSSCSTHLTKLWVARIPSFTNLLPLQSPSRRSRSHSCANLSGGEAYCPRSADHGRGGEYAGVSGGPPSFRVSCRQRERHLHEAHMRGYAWMRL